MPGACRTCYHSDDGGLWLGRRFVAYHSYRAGCTLQAALTLSTHRDNIIRAAIHGKGNVNAGLCPQDFEGAPAASVQASHCHHVRLNWSILNLSIKMRYFRGPAQHKGHGQGGDYRISSRAKGHWPVDWPRLHVGRPIDDAMGRAHQPNVSDGGWRTPHLACDGRDGL